MYQYTGYIARIREPSSENFDYRDLKRVVEQDNKLVLYATRIDRSIRDKFTWEKTLDELARHPPIGGVCVTFHDHPITFGEFVEAEAEVFCLTRLDISTSGTGCRLQILGILPSSLQAIIKWTRLYSIIVEE